MKFYDIELDRTDCTVIHQEVVDAVRGRMPVDDLLLDLADSFKLFSDSTRLKILYALMEAPRQITARRCSPASTPTSFSPVSASIWA